jgi:hypothetical protein
MRWTWFSAALLLISLISRPAQAQLFGGVLVRDLITEAQTSITAVQTTISAVEAVIHTAKWIIEQTPLDDFVLAGDLSEDLATLNALVHEAQALGYDISSLSAMISALFSLESAPGTTSELQVRLWEIRRQVHLGWGYALRVQGLIQTAIRTISHVLRLYEQITALLGNLGGHQNLAQQLNKLVQLETEAKVATNAFQLAQSLDRLTEPLVDESLQLINETIMSTHPR